MVWTALVLGCGGAGRVGSLRASVESNVPVGAIVLAAAGIVVVALSTEAGRRVTTPNLRYAAWAAAPVGLLLALSGGLSAFLDATFPPVVVARIERGDRVVVARSLLLDIDQVEVCDCGRWICRCSAEPTDACDASAGPDLQMDAAGALTLCGEPIAP